MTILVAPLNSVDPARGQDLQEQFQNLERVREQDAAYCEERYRYYSSGDYFEEGKSVKDGRVGSWNEHGCVLYDLGPFGVEFTNQYGNRALWKFKYVGGCKMLCEYAVRYGKPDETCFRLHSNEEGGAC